MTVDVYSLSRVSNVALYRIYCADFDIFPLSCFSDAILHRIYCTDFSVDVSGMKLPDCAYVVGVPCRECAFGFHTPVCSGYGNDAGEFFRCSLLPSWVSDAYHDCRFYGGKLHAS